MKQIEIVILLYPALNNLALGSVKRSTNEEHEDAAGAFLILCGFVLLIVNSIHKILIY